ncbi:MAG: hypothetical protein AAFR09_04820 [Pseudomonadota bacterium]
MNRNVLFWVLGLVLAAGVVAIWASRAPSVAPPLERPASTQAEPSGEASEPAELPASPDAGTVSGATYSIAELEQALQLATERREQAEQVLDESERDVERLEAFVAEIRARGEDPADYADEGLEQFQPAFMRYQRAFAVFEEAELVEQAARDTLAEARAASP